MQNHQTEVRNEPGKARFDAYTSVRMDIAGLIPLDAQNILDVGCSNGALGRYLKSNDPTKKVVGIEIDSKLSEIASGFLDSVIQCDLENLSIDASLAPFAPFDCIVCADVLEHLRDPERALAALSNILVPNGSLIVGLPNVRHHSALWQICFRGSFPRRERGIFDSTHLRWFTYSDGVALLRSASLEIDRAEFNVRMGDKGGGLLNRIAGKVLDPLSHWWIVREFFVYQFVLRATRST